MDNGGFDGGFGAGSGDDGGFGSDGGGFEQPQKKQQLPADLPRTLDDRRHAPTEHLVTETEMYDGWQGRLPLVCLMRPWLGGASSHHSSLHVSDWPDLLLTLRLIRTITVLDNTHTGQASELQQPSPQRPPVRRGHHQGRDRQRD